MNTKQGAIRSYRVRAERRTWRPLHAGTVAAVLLAALALLVLAPLMSRGAPAVVVAEVTKNEGDPESLGRVQVRLGDRAPRVA